MSGKRRHCALNLRKRLSETKWYLEYRERKEKYRRKRSINQHRVTEKQIGERTSEKGNNVMHHGYFRGLNSRIQFARFSRSIDSMLYLRMRRMRLTAGIRIGAVYASLLVVFPIARGIHRLCRWRLHLRAEDLLVRGWFHRHAGSHRLHLLADGVTKVAGRQWHYIFRVSELFVFLETRPRWKVSVCRRRTAATKRRLQRHCDPKNLEKTAHLSSVYEYTQVAKCFSVVVGYMNFYLFKLTTKRFCLPIFTFQNYLDSPSHGFSLLLLPSLCSIV